MNSKFPIPISLQPESVSLCHFKLRLFGLTEFIAEISKIYDIVLQRYRDYKIRVCGKTGAWLLFLFAFSMKLSIVDLSGKLEDRRILTFCDFCMKKNKKIKQNFEKIFKINFIFSA